MKKSNFLTKAVGIGMMSTFTFGLANNAVFAQDSQVNCTVLPASEGKKLVVSFKQIEGNDLKYSIRDHFGYTYTEEDITGSNQYAKVLNLNDLADGEYIFSYQTNGLEKSTLLTIQGASLKISNKAKLKSYFTPVHWKQDGNKVNLFVDNESREALTVSILNKEGKLVFTRYFNENNDYLKRLDLANLDAGDYTLLFSKGEIDIQEQLVIK